MIIDAHVHITENGKWFNTNHNASVGGLIKSLGKEPIVNKGNKLCGYVFRFITPKPGKVKRVSGVEEALKLEGVVAGACFVKQGVL